ncbi:MAG: ArsR family transcriptional regulator [Candidatus Helarchaeota archaeon]|nr:ArsR family transcriptional regulator [Candidatus Helarchaeota archaeon]
MDQLDISRHTIDRHLAFLEGANLINSKGNVYYITNEGKEQITMGKEERKTESTDS